MNGDTNSKANHSFSFWWLAYCLLSTAHHVPLHYSLRRLSHPMASGLILTLPKEHLCRKELSFPTVQSASPLTALHWSGGQSWLCICPGEGMLLAEGLCATLCMKLHIEIFTMRVLKFPIPGFSVRAAQSNSGLYGLDTFDPLFKYVVYHGCFPTPMLAYSWETVLNAYFILCVCATVWVRMGATCM